MKTINEIVDSLCYIVVTAKQVEYFPYLHQEPRDILFSLDRDERLEKLLVQKSQGYKDNHTCYRITTKNDNQLCFYCSDDKIHVSLGIRPSTY